jgi:putative membrane protein
MMNWYGNGMSGWGYALMTVSTTLFWGLLIVATIALVRYLRRTSQPAGNPPIHRSTPEQLLAERYARGEIDEEEYQRRMTTLRAAAPTTR